MNAVVGSEGEVSDPAISILISTAHEMILIYIIGPRSIRLISLRCFLLAYEKQNTGIISG